MGEKSLTTKSVAEMLGVSEATVKRWVDKRVLRAERTAGGHRRFRIAEVSRFLMRARSKESEPFKTLSAETDEVAASSLAALRVSSQLLLDALLAGREDESAALMIQPYLRGYMVAEIFDRLFCETMNVIGKLWYGDELTIAQEHLATHTAMSALRALRSVIALKELNGLVAVCCSVEDDFHELPIQLAQIIFETQGYGVINLGANTPLFALEEAVKRHRPDIVCISSTILFHRDRNAHEYGSFHLTARQMGIAVVLGGRGFTNEESARKRFPADIHAESFGQLQEFLQTR